MLPTTTCCLDFALSRCSNTYEGGSFGQAWGFNQQVSHNDRPILSIDGVCTFVAVLVYMFTWKAAGQAVLSCIAHYCMQHVFNIPVADTLLQSTAWVRLHLAANLIGLPCAGTHPSSGRTGPTRAKQTRLRTAGTWDCSRTSKVTTAAFI